MKFLITGGSGFVGKKFLIVIFLSFLVFSNYPVVLAEYENNYKFTGKELDKDTGLYYFGARYYEPSVGRFIGEDPLTQAIASNNKERLNEILANPQSLNNYSYALNNPLKFVDPDGRETIVYTEKAKLSDGLDAVAGHSFVGINRDNQETIYNWNSGVGNVELSNGITVDLEISDSQSFFQQNGKNNDIFNKYIFNTSVEQENSIKGFYANLAEKNNSFLSGDERINFNVLGYNCTDVVVGALKAGSIVTSNFVANNLFNIAKPSVLQSKLDSKYFWQNIASNKFLRWIYPRSINEIMRIENKSIYKTQP